MRVAESAHKHGAAVEEIRHAVANAIRFHDLDEGLVMIVGPTATGALIEVGLVAADDDDPIAVHAMAARATFL
ncbi:MAG TPA: hypothetical protein VM143_13390 [Acidimicrobiales bacterium]|nr:hypothetical protein [Acidimicrobiales bacterium]